VKDEELDQTNEDGAGFFTGLLLLCGLAAVIVAGLSSVGPCSAGQLEIDGQCYEFTQLEDEFYDTWSTLEAENPEGIGLDLLVSETRLESKNQVLQMIRHLKDEGRATCFKSSMLVEECLPANTTETEGGTE
jgi:hypothetical protein